MPSGESIFVLVKGIAYRVASATGNLVIPRPPGFVGIANVVPGFFHQIGIYRVLDRKAATAGTGIFYLQQLRPVSMAARGWTAAGRSSKRVVKKYAFSGNAVKGGCLYGFIAIG